MAKRSSNVVASQLPTYTSDFTFNPPAVPDVGITYTALNQSLGEVGRFVEQSMKEKSNEIAQSNQFTMGADIINQSNDILKKWSAQNDKSAAVDGYKKSYQSYADNVLDSTPDKNRLYAERLLFSLGQKGAKELEDAQVKQANASNLEQFKLNMSTLNDHLQNLSQRPDKTSQKQALATLGQMHQLADNGAANSTISYDAAANYKVTAHQNLERNRILGVGHVSVEEGGDSITKFKDRILNGHEFDKLLSPAQRQGIVNDIDKYAANQKFKFGLNQTQVKQLNDDAMFQASQGVMPDPSTIALLKATSPEKANEIQNNLDMAYQAGTKINSVNSMTIPDQLSALDEARLPLTKDEMAIPGSAERNKYKNIVAKGIANNLKIWTTAPAVAVEADSAFRNQDAQLRASLLKYPPTDSRYPVALQTYLRQRTSLLLNYQATKGIPYDQRQALTPNDVTALTTQVKQMPLQNVPSFLSSLRESYGAQNFPILLNQLSPKIGIANMSLYNASINPRSAHMLPDLIAAYSSDMKKMETLLPSGITVDDIKKAFNKKALNYYMTYGQANGDVSGFLSSLLNKATQIAIYEITSKKAKSVDQAVQFAYDALIGNNHNIVNYKGGHYVRLPIDDDENMHLKAMHAIQYNVITNPPKDLRIPDWFSNHYSYLPPNERKTLYIEQELTNGYYGNTQSGNGVVLYSRQGVPVQTMTGQTFGYRFSQLNNPNSDIYKQIHQMEESQVKIPLAPPPWWGGKARLPSVLELVTGQSLNLGDLRSRTKALFNKI